jgi:hypothetical protein
MSVTDYCRYTFSQIRILSLPIPQSFALLAVILPVITGITTRISYGFFRSYNSSPRSILCLVAIFTIQLIYETIIATLAVTYMGSNCGLEEQWSRLYREKNANAIMRIQNRFKCCGFNTMVDRSWPFPHGRPQDGFGAHQCERMYSRNTSCAGPFRRAERIHAGVFFTVATALFTVKVRGAVHNPLLVCFPDRLLWDEESVFFLIFMIDTPSSYLLLLLTSSVIRLPSLFSSSATYLLRYYVDGCARSTPYFPTICLSIPTAMLIQEG